MRINFDFGDLEAFVAVFESGSFQRAAEQLAISQSAITRRIQKLETALDVILFERTTRSLRATLAGKEFCARAQAILDDAGEALRALGDATLRYRHQRNAVVTIATVRTLAQNLIPRALKRNGDNGPLVRINLLDLFADEVSNAVLSGEADFGIGFLGMQEYGLDFEYLCDDPFVLAIPQDHELAQEKSIRWADLASYRLIVPQKGSGNRLLIDNALARRRILLDWTFQVRHFSTALGLVQSGLGVAVLPATAISPFGDGGVQSRPIVEPVVCRSIGGVRRSGKSLPQIAENLYRILASECRAADP